MAETRFTKAIKGNLSETLNSWMEDEGLPYKAKPEYLVHSRGSRNLIDVAIIDPDDELRLVGIELEVRSNPDQIITNRRKFKEWVTASKNRYGGLLHIIFSDANISQQRMYRLLRDAYASIASGKGFYYEFMAVEPDYRESYETARYLVEESWEFDARLWALINEVFEG